MPVTNVAKELVPLPFTLKASVELEDHGGMCSWIYIMGCTDNDVLSSAGAFDITLTSRLTTRAIESLVAEMHLGEGAGGIKCIAAQGSGTGRFGRGVSGLDSGPVGVIGASWSFDSNRKVCIYHGICYYLMISHNLDIAMGDSRHPSIKQLEPPWLVHHSSVSHPLHTSEPGSVTYD
jgi:hypothetical protein